MAQERTSKALATSLKLKFQNAENVPISLPVRVQDEIDRSQ
jgi:cell division ATPase FtsA